MGIEENDNYFEGNYLQSKREILEKNRENKLS